MARPAVRPIAQEDYAGYCDNCRRATAVLELDLPTLVGDSTVRAPTIGLKLCDVCLVDHVARDRARR